MDGVFVPNISFGFPVMKPIRRASAKFLDVHLMIVEPEKYLRRFAEAGADLVTFHYEATQDPLGAIRMIKECGVKAGISVKPATPVEVLGELLPELDLVLIMSVEPGFGGQSFMEGSWEKVRRLRRMIDDRGLPVLIEIDGGVSASNAGDLFAAGCDALVAGSAVFGAATRGGNREDAGGTVLPVTAAGAGSCRMCGREPWRMRYPKGAPLRCAFGHGMAHTVFAAGEACLKRIRLTDDFSR